MLRYRSDWHDHDSDHQEPEQDEENSPSKGHQRSSGTMMDPRDQIWKQEPGSDGDDKQRSRKGRFYQQSFTLEPKSELPPNGLHHRSNTTTATNTQRFYHSSVSPPRSPQNPAFAASRQQQQQQRLLHHSSHSRHWTIWNSCHPRHRPSLVRWCLAIGFGSYVILLIRSSYWLLHSSREAADISQAQHRVPIPPLDSSLYGNTVRETATRGLWQQNGAILKRDAIVEMQERARLRKERTLPSSIHNVSQPLLTITWYNMERLENGADRRQPPTDSVLAATVDQLCGATAKQAAPQNAQLYPASKVLNSKARVLITGILNPLGFSLALHLKEVCGVSVIGGNDYMFPNTVQNRLQLTERMQLLTTNIPRLVKPIGLPYVGLEPKLKKDEVEMDVIASFRPTHIVHLASFAQEVYSEDLVDPEWKNDFSPYSAKDYTATLYQLRSSMLSMEQLLRAVSNVQDPIERPQFIFASTNHPEAVHPAHATTKRMDEVLADIYFQEYGIQSTGLRLPNAIYGPWGQAGGVVHDMIEAAVQKWDATSKDQLVLHSKSESLPSSLDMVYVDDIVEAMIAILQHQPQEAAGVQLTALLETSAASLASTIQSFLPLGKKAGAAAAVNQQNPLLEKLLEQHHARSAAKRKFLNWSPKTSLRDGILKTLAWHLDRTAPFGPAKGETGDELLSRHGMSSCSPDDLLCHRAPQFLPCASECNIRDQCVSTIFDEVKEMMIGATDGCDVVLYTQSLGYNVEELPLHAEYMDDSELDDDDTLVCNVAVVPRNSDLVSTVIGKVPDNQLAKFDIKPKATDGRNDMKERKLDGLNGRLLYKGWILVWVKDATEAMDTSELSLLKLSPGKFFAKDVRSALFVEENFPVSPNIEDVLFLVGEMRRKAFARRTSKKDILVKDASGHDVVKRAKYRLPEEPKRRAAMLFAPLRFPNIDEHKLQRYRSGEKKLSVHDATKFMRYEVGLDPEDREPMDIRRQREFYERVPTYINKNTELRSNYEPLYRYAMRHWVRTRWVVHDLHLEDSRLLRCDWYQEHVQWGTELDQLSFAHVMATRELKRRMAHNEPDDRVQTFVERHPELKDLLDSYEWYAMETEHNKLYREPVVWDALVPEHVVPDEKKSEEAVIEDDAHLPNPLFVRIMSERIMAASRKIWTKKRKKELDAKKKKKKHAKEKTHATNK